MATKTKHLKTGMGGSSSGKSRTEKTETLKKESKKLRRQADKRITEEYQLDKMQSTIFTSQLIVLNVNIPF